LIIYFAIDRKFLSPYGTALLICSLRTAKWGHANWSNERAAAIIAVHRSAEGAVLPILHALQEEFGCIPEEAVPLVAVNGASRWRTLADLVDGARAKPFDLTMAGSGTGTFFHVAFEIFKRATKVSMTYVPYSGGAPAVTALFGDHVTSAFTDYPTLAEQLNTGKLRALATKTRTRPLHDVPTIAQAGYEDDEAHNWFGAFAPAKTPREKVSRLAGWFTAAMHAPAIEARLVGLGFFPTGQCGADFAALLRRQYEDYGRAIREANIKAE
jgi:tripartite-type tricarboxylate transporter receptor subunit TctC